MASPGKDAAAPARTRLRFRPPAPKPDSPAKRTGEELAPTAKKIRPSSPKEAPRAPYGGPKLTLASPAYAGMSPAYGGMSPAYGAAMSPAYGSASPAYGGLSPTRRPPEELGGVLKVPVPQVLKEVQEGKSVALKRKLEVVGTAGKISQALKTMAAAQVRSLPVVDPGTGKLVGVLDLFDLVFHVVGAFTDEEIAGAKIGVAAPAADSPVVAKAEAVFEQCTVLDVLDAQEAGSCASVTVPETGGASGVVLLDVVKKAFLARKDGSSAVAVHRAVLIDHQGFPITTISQSDLLRYLYKSKDMVTASSKSAYMTLQQLGLTARPVLRLDSRTSLLYCLWKMKRFKVYSAAVVDAKSGELVQQLTVNHLRGLTAAELPQLLRPVTDFVVAAARHREPCVVKHDDPLWRVLEVLVSSKHLRAIILDARGRATAQISALNVILTLMRPPKQPRSPKEAARRPPGRPADSS
eukprot:TRINITY_DN7532_c0_g1_i1.p1 TRINITY_DN7532_c0_g1~~TRINITY_DN7532_c0_g1_i1.p1  ORF type:complete len:488 (+),score=146.57 TRINITY_DN7532_c0_g1_i1:67-1464(+)